MVRREVCWQRWRAWGALDRICSREQGRARMELDEGGGQG